MESLSGLLSNGSNLIFKFHPSRPQSSKQYASVSEPESKGCCVTSTWAHGPCNPRGVRPLPWPPPLVITPYRSCRLPLLELGFVEFRFSHCANFCSSVVSDDHLSRQPSGSHLCFSIPSTLHSYSQYQIAYILFLLVLRLLAGIEPRVQVDRASSTVNNVSELVQRLLRRKRRRTVVVGSRESPPPKSIVINLIERSGTPPPSSGIRAQGCSVRVYCLS